MSLRKLLEISELLGGFCRVVGQIIIERYIWRIYEPTETDLLDPAFVSELMGRRILAVAPTNKSISLGGGGTGTTRMALTFTFEDRSTLRVFVKLPTSSMFERVFLTLFSVYSNELNFYSNILPLLPKDSNNKCTWCPQVHALRSYGTGNFVIVFEDLCDRPGGTQFLSLQDAVSQAQLCSALSQLARLHVAFWGRPPAFAPEKKHEPRRKLPGYSNLDASAGVWSYCQDTGASLGSTPPFLGVFVDAGLRRLRAMSASRRQRSDTEAGTGDEGVMVLPPRVEKALMLFVEHYKTIRAAWSRGTLTLCHGDTHIGNMFFSGAQSPSSLPSAGLLDMQCVVADKSIRDVSYFLVLSVAPDELAAIEPELLRHYVLEVNRGLASSSTAAPPLDLEEATFMYRYYSVWPLVAWVICCGANNLIAEDFLLLGARRVAATCSRLDTLGALMSLLRREGGQLSAPMEDFDDAFGDKKKLIYL